MPRAMLAYLGELCVGSINQYAVIQSITPQLFPSQTASPIKRNQENGLALLMCSRTIQQCDPGARVLDITVIWLVPRALIDCNYYNYHVAGEGQISEP